MKDVWQEVWKSGELEWKKEDIINSSTLQRISTKIEEYFQKNNLDKINIAELGAGVGLASYFFAKQGASVNLIDNSTNAKNLAKKWWDKDKHNYILADLFKYNKKSFDVVISLGLCEHFIKEKRGEVLKKHVSLLKNKGMAIISVPYKWGIFYQLSKAVAKTLGKWNFGLEVPFTKKEFKNFANENNLKCELILEGFYSSAYDFLIRKPLKLIGIKVKRRFDDTKSIFDNLFGCGIIAIFYK